MILENISVCEKDDVFISSPSDIIPHLIPFSDFKTEHFTIVALNHAFKVLSIRTLFMLGVQKLIVSAAVGSLDVKLTPGSLCVLNDHINFMCNNPLIGNHDPAFGPMFFDLSEAYAKPLRKIALDACKKLKINAKEGSYFAVTGPNFETPSEIRAFKTLGATVVGMSVVPEVLVARQCGIEVLGLTWVTNLGCGLAKGALSHAQTIAETKKIEGKFRKLLEAILPKL